jgi:hypothetical protein
MSELQAVAGTSPDISETTNSFAQQSILASSKANCVHLNANLQTIYDSAVVDYNRNMEIGVKHDPPLKPPIAPLTWVVLPPNSDGYQFYDQTGPALTPTPPLKLDTTDLGSLASLTPSTAPQGVFMGIGKQNGMSKFYDANYGDTVPSGLPAPPTSDGHTYLKYGSPVGWGWWLQTS